MVGRERARFAAFQVEHTDKAIDAKQRHDELGTDFHAGFQITGQVAGILANVIDADGTFLCSGSSSNALVERHA